MIYIHNTQVKSPFLVHKAQTTINETDKKPSPSTHTNNFFINPIRGANFPTTKQPSFWECHRSFEAMRWWKTIRNAHASHLWKIRATTAGKTLHSLNRSSSTPACWWNCSTIPYLSVCLSPLHHSAFVGESIDTQRHWLCVCTGSHALLPTSCFEETRRSAGIAASVLRTCSLAWTSNVLTMLWWNSWGLFNLRPGYAEQSRALMFSGVNMGKSGRCCIVCRKFDRNLISNCET